MAPRVLANTSRSPSSRGLYASVVQKSLHRLVSRWPLRTERISQEECDYDLGNE